MKQRILKAIVKSILISILVLAIILIFLMICMPYKDITYLDNENKSKVTITIDNSLSLDVMYLYNDTSLAWSNRLDSWVDVFLNNIFIVKEDKIQSITLKKFMVTLYDFKGNIIPFKRIDWYQGGELTDKNIIHFKDENDLLKANNKMEGVGIYYIFDELDNKKLKIEYNFIFEINGKTYEIRDSKELHRNVKWKVWSIFSI